LFFEKNEMEKVDSKQLKLAREKFDWLLNKQTTEVEWQKFFARYPFALIPSLPLRLEPKDIVPLGRPGKTEPDLIFYPHENHMVNPFYGVIELKRADQRIASIVRNNTAILTRNAQMAVVQAEQYCKLMPSLIPKEFQGINICLGNDKYLFVIIGMSDQELIFKPGNELFCEMINTQLPKNLKLLPYDFLWKNFNRYAHEIFILVPTGQKQDRIIHLRAEPADLLSFDVQKMLQNFDFYDRRRNWTGKGIKHQYEILEQKSTKVIIDRITELMWQRGGSDNYMDFNAANQWIKNLNEHGLAGYRDWRLPTLEEAMSLLEPSQNSNGLYIDSIFSKEQIRIWTTDKFKWEPFTWVVDLFRGYCGYGLFDSSYYVRAVRSGESSTG
jgi:hypothetical protein